MNFREWLINEFKIKDIFDIDENDAAFLKQFPELYQAQALKYRYGLLKSRKLGNIRDVMLRRGHPHHSSKEEGARVFRNIDTKINELADKLEKRGLNPDTVTLTMTEAYSIVSLWRQMSTSNPDDTDRMLTELQLKIEKYLESLLLLLSNPKRTLHLNYYYWKTPDKKAQLVSFGLEYIKRVSSNKPQRLMHILDNTSLLKRLLSNFFVSKFQNGLVSRKLLKKANINVFDLMQKGWSPYKIAGAIKSKDEVRLNYMRTNIADWSRKIA